MANRTIFAFTVILAAVYLYATEQFPVLEVSDPLGPKAFPRLIVAGLLLTAGLFLADISRVPRNETGGGGEKVPLRWRQYLIVGGVVIWTGLYFAVFKWLGYTIATAGYILALTTFFHRGKWTANLLTSALYSFISYLMFAKLLDVPLPRGILPF
jgi:putative tricarboxylic transport membrane protein